MKPPRRLVAAARFAWLACLCLTSVLVGMAGAEEGASSSPLDSFRWMGEATLGGRATWGDDEEGKLLEYRDFDNGILGSFRVLLEDKEGKYFLRAGGSNIGYDDQRYEMEGGRYGRYRAELFYGELPHVFSTSARTLYQRPSGNQFLLPAGVQSRIANAANASAQLATELLSAQPVDLGFRQIEGGAGVEYRVNEETRLFGRYHLRDRKGSRPMAIQFGSPGGSFNVFASPVDDDTHQVEGGIEYVAGPVALGLEYLGSFYNNEFRATTVDNPLVELDATNAASRGRSSLDPDNSAHTISAFGSLALPFSFPARLAANFAYGLRLQDEDFLPHTINTAIANPSLTASNLDGEIHTLLANLVATARPIPKLNLKARYRIYRYDDETDALRLPQWVRNDDAARNETFRSVRSDYTRQDANLSASYRLASDLKGTFGYYLEAWHRSDDRQVEDLVEHGPKVELDWRVHARATLRASYAFKDREGDDYETLAFFESKLDPAEFAALEASGISELPGLRKFDQADRRLHQIDLIGHVIPSENTDLTIDGGWKDIDYHDSDFGLTDQRSWHLGVDGFYQFHPRVGVGAWYSFEEISYHQDSRWRPRTFIPPITLVDDARNDWQNRDKSRFHTLGTNLLVEAIVDRLDLEIGYQLHLGKEKTRDRAVPGFIGTGGVGVGNDGGADFAYPDVEETLHVFTASATLRVSDPLKLRAQYRYEDFQIRDYRTDNLGPFRGRTDVYLGDSIEDYGAHILVMSAVVSF
jgi:MtrB/PioB family decaheme-associated outer membrane protein